MRLTLVVFLLFFSGYLFAQKNAQTVTGIKLHYGTIYIHTPSVKNVAGARPYGAELEFSKQPVDSASVSKCNCFARNGVVVSYFNFNNHILGSVTTLSYFLEPVYKLNDKLQFILRGATGLTYASNPYDIIKNPDNKSYTTHTNAFLQAALGVGYNVSKKTKLQFMAGFQHFSNGDFKEPNRGVNWITASVGILHYSQNTSLPTYPHSSNKNIKHTKLKIDAGILFVPRQGYNSKIMAQSDVIAGAFVQVTKQYGRISSITGGAEIYYNKLTKQTGNESRWLAGIHAGHAFTFGRVIFNQQLGLHIYNPYTDVMALYFRYGLLYRITDHLVTGINLKTHADNADFTDFRIMYRF